MASGGASVKKQTFDMPTSAPPYARDAYKDLGLREWVYAAGTRKKVSNPAVQRYVAKAMVPKVANDNDRMLEAKYLKQSTITVPWCAYFVNAKLEYAGYSGTKNGMARSFLKWGVEVDHEDDEAWQVGDICVIWRGRYDDGVTGHVFFLLWWDDQNVYGLGGNQGDAVTIQAFPRSKLLGMRRPRAWTASRTVRANAGAGANETLVKPAVDMALAEPTAPVSKTQVIAEAAEQAKGPLEQLAQWKPWIMGVLTFITIALIIYGIYCRIEDHKSGRNT